MSNSSFDPAALAEVRRLSAQLSALPEPVLLYIVGYAEGVLAMAAEQARNNASPPQEGDDTG